jgi:hypothetical protein
VPVGLIGHGRRGITPERRGHRSIMDLRYLSRNFAITLGGLLWGLCAAAATSTDTIEPAVKLSQSGICHERGSPSYDATLHYQSFETLADCIEAGGRAAKRGHREKRPSAQMEANVPVDGDSAQILYVGLGIAVLMAVGVVSMLNRDSRRNRGWLRSTSSQSKTPASERQNISSDEEKLLKACLGSTEVVARLVQYELDRNSSLSWGAAASAALARLERDSR